mgnify:CR=1 FL=1
MTSQTNGAFDRTPLIAGNWKMNLDHQQGVALLQKLAWTLQDAKHDFDRVEVAGSVFLGDWTPEALGDYCSGTNHVLPTGGAARAWSGVSVSSFQNTVSVQSASAAGIRAIGPDAVTMARAEGLDAHANAVALRIAKAAA